MNELYQNTLELEVDIAERTGDLDFWQMICRRRAGSAPCPVCEKPVDLMTVADAARCFKTDLQDIRYLGESGALHRVHNCYGEEMICCDSLFKSFDTRATRLLDSHFEERINRSRL